MRTHTLKKLAHTLLIMLMVCLSITHTAFAESPDNQEQTEQNLNINIKTVDTALEREPSIIDIYQGQYVDSGQYQLYKDEALTEPIYFTKLHAHYTVCQADNPDATQDMICDIGVLTIEGLSESTYWLTQTDPPDTRRTLEHPIKLILTEDQSNPENLISKLALDETDKSKFAIVEKDNYLVIDYNEQKDAFAQTMLIILAILLIIIIIVIVYIFTNNNYDKHKSDQVHQP